MSVRPLELVTERLILTRPAADDHQALFALTEPAVTRAHLSSQPPSLADSFQRMLRNAGSWALFGYGLFNVAARDEPDALIGTCGLFRAARGLGADFDAPEAGWIVAHDRWGQGVAREAMAAALAWFDAEHGPRRTVAMIAPGNAASFRLAERLGFARYAERELPGGDQVVLLERLSPR